MSGSAGGPGSINISITASDAELASAIRSAVGSLQGLDSSAKAIDSSFKAASSAATGLMNSMRQQAQSTMEAANNFNQASTAATGLMNSMRQQAQSSMDAANKIQQVSTAATGLMSSMRQQAQASMDAARAMNQASTAATGLMNAMRQQAQATMNATTSNNSASVAATGLMQSMRQQAQAAMDAGRTMTEAAQGADRMKVASSGVTREIIVIGHEAMVGQFSRIPGSLVVLAEMMGSVGLATMGVVAALGLAAMAASKLVDWMHRVKEARAMATASAAAFNPNLNQDEISTLVDEYRTQRRISTNDAGEVIATFASIKGANSEMIRALVDNTLLFATATGDKLPNAAAKLKTAFESPTEMGPSFLRDLNASSELIEKFSNIAGQNATIERRKILLEQLAAVTARVGKTTDQTKQSMFDGIYKEMDFMPPAGNLPNDPSMIGGQSEAMYARVEARQREADEKRRANHRAAILGMSSDEKMLANVSWFDRMQEGAQELRVKTLSTVTDYRRARFEESKALAEYWADAEKQTEQGSRNQLRAHEAYLQAKRNMDEAALRLNPATTWFEQQQLGAAELREKTMAAATDWKTARSEEYTALAAFWEKAAGQAAAGSENFRKARMEFLRYKEMADAANLRGTSAPSWFEQQQLGAAELREKTMAAATDWKTARSQEYTALAEYWRKATATVQQGTQDHRRAYMEYLRYKEMADAGALRTSFTSSQLGVRAQIAALEAQQAANRNNYDLVMQIENQKLDLLRRSYGEQSREYQNMLKHKATLEQNHAQNVARMSVEDAAKQSQIGFTNIQTRIKQLNAEVAARRMSRDEAIQAAKQFTTETEQTQLNSLDELIRNLTKGTEEYARAMRMRELISSRFAKVQAEFAAQEASATQRALQGTVNAFTSTFDQIAQVGKSSIYGLISGTVSWYDTWNRVLSTMLTSFIESMFMMVARWAITQLAMTQISTVQNAVRVAQEAGGTGFAAMIGAMLAKWMGLESAKSAITATSVPVRAAAEIAGIEAVTAAKGAAAVIEAPIRMASAISQINTAAAIAGANAFAATAAIPVVGPGLAPGAAAAAVASVEAFQAMVPLEVGAWNIPKTMPALLHPGEMVVPANFASGLRNSMGGGNTTNQSMPTLNYSPTINGGTAYGQSANNMETLLRRNSREMWNYIWSVTRQGTFALPGRGIG